MNKEIKKIDEAIKWVDDNPRKLEILRRGEKINIEKFLVRDKFLKRKKLLATENTNEKRIRLNKERKERRDKFLKAATKEKIQEYREKHRQQSKNYRQKAKKQ